jgi:hypothetical protein
MVHQSSHGETDVPNASKDVLKERLNSIPRCIYGTAFQGAQTSSVVTYALGAGFAGIDTAAVTNTYQERLVGQAIQSIVAKGVLKREDIWVSALILSLSLSLSLSPQKSLVWVSPAFKKGSELTLWTLVTLIDSIQILALQPY